MELWEGAILVVGGLYLVTVMARRQPGVAVSPNANLANLSGRGQSGLTTATNTAGTDYLVAGEQLAAPTPSLATSTISVNSQPTIPVQSAPVFGQSNGATRPVAQGRHGARRGPVVTAL
jgi:hypothetical protein